jgi:hypothetical protein
MHHQDSEFLVYKLFLVSSFLREHRREGREWKERRERRKERRVSKSLELREGRFLVLLSYLI